MKLEYEIKVNAKTKKANMYDVYRKGLCKGVLILDEEYQKLEIKSMILEAELR